MSANLSAHDMSSFNGVPRGKSKANDRFPRFGLRPRRSLSCGSFPRGGKGVRSNRVGVRCTKGFDLLRLVRAMMNLLECPGEYPLDDFVLMYKSLHNMNFV